MKFKILIVLAAWAIGFTSCSTKEKGGEEVEATTTEADPNEWPELDSFHMIMAEAFHPYKDSTNLEPVKRLAEEMALEADKWAATSLPEKVNTDAVKDQLNQLKTDTRSLADKIKGGASDEEIGTSLKALHDSFHGIMEAWNGSGEKHEHQH
ncbi:MAG TPA: hypothetical protein PLJ13_05760 [Cyclobacteriaceae bacterium]|nr:hypothetical protein [Cyclobacteriaceae bacterium]